MGANNCIGFDNDGGVEFGLRVHHCGGMNGHGVFGLVRCKLSG
jgi:hypothetical protein